MNKCRFLIRVNYSFLKFLKDGALLATNAVQLKTLLTTPVTKQDSLWIVSLVFVSISIIAQCLMAVLLGILANNSIADDSRRRFNNILNDIVLGLTGIVFVTNIITNVFIQVNISDLTKNITKV